MKVLVTGASGHIGSNVVRAALRAGMTPVALHREGSDRRGLSGVQAETRLGDLLDAESVQRAMTGVTHVLHVGAVHRNFDIDPARIERPRSRLTPPSRAARTGTVSRTPALYGPCSGR